MYGALLSFRSAQTFGRPHVLLRHAERDRIDDPTVGWDAALTDRGRATAVDLGRELAADGPFSVSHSPVPRCGETAEALTEGIRAAGGQVRADGVVDALAGPYLRNPVEAMQAARDLGDRFVRAWFAGELPVELIDGRADSARSQLRAMVKSAAAQRGASDEARSAAAPCALLVSHDWNLLAVREEYFGIRHEQAGWPGFLDGVALVLTDKGVVLTYRERIQQIPLRKIQ